MTQSTNPGIERHTTRPIEGSDFNSLATAFFHLHNVISTVFPGRRTYYFQEYHPVGGTVEYTVFYYEGKWKKRADFTLIRPNYSYNELVGLAQKTRDDDETLKVY